MSSLLSMSFFLMGYWVTDSMSLRQAQPHLKVRSRTLFLPSKPLLE